MGYYDPDPYNQPEEFNLTIIGNVEWYDEPYSFDMSVVWKHNTTGQLYYAEDSGCSCPAPFGNCNSMDDLTPVTVPELLDILTKRAGHKAVKAAELFEKVMRHHG